MQLFSTSYSSCAFTAVQLCSQLCKNMSTTIITQHSHVLASQIGEMPKECGLGFVFDAKSRFDIENRQNPNKSKKSMSGEIVFWRRTWSKSDWRTNGDIALLYEKCSSVFIFRVRWVNWLRIFLHPVRETCILGKVRTLRTIWW